MSVFNWGAEDWARYHLRRETEQQSYVDALWDQLADPQNRPERWLRHHYDRLRGMKARGAREARALIAEELDSRMPPLEPATPESPTPGLLALQEGEGELEDLSPEIGDTSASDH